MFYVLSALIILNLIRYLHSNNCTIVEENRYIKADCRNLKLTDVPQDLPKNIQALDLSSNCLTNLSRSSFVEYGELRNLSINGNSLENIHPECFHSMKKLQALEMADNSLNISDVFKLETFTNTSSLLLLDIRRNMKNSKEIRTYYDYPGFALSMLTNLTSLFMDLVPFPRFGLDFKNMRNLKVLVFDLCFLAYMTNNTFQNLSSSVRELHLLRCKDVKGYSVECGFLNPFPYLKVLDLTDTHVHLSRALFLLYPLRNSTMDVINFQHVSHDHLETDIMPYSLVITDSMMKYLRTICVKTLNLADNGIVDFGPNSLFSFYYPECFENIVLSANRFMFHTERKRKEMYLFVNKLQNILLFDFSYNPISFSEVKYLTIPNGDIQANPESTDCTTDALGNITYVLPPKLRILRFSHFQRKCCVDSVVIKNASSLIQLDMSNFQFIKFPDLYIIGENNLQWLNGSGIDSSLYFQKRSIPLFQNVKYAYFRNVQLSKSASNSKNLFTLIPAVEVLDISHNNLIVLHPQSFQTNTNLTTLDLSNNLLSEIPEAVQNIAKLSMLDMRNNHLITINSNLTDWFDSFTNFTLLLSGNTFSCSCENRQLILWLFKTRVNMDENKNYSCRLPNGTIKNTKEVYLKFHDAFIDCDIKMWLKIGIGLLVTFTVLALPATIIFSFRWRIAYCIFHKFRNVVESGMNLIFTYDAYVSYAEDSTDWVKNSLAMKVEGKWGLSLCIEERDLTAGQSYTDLIAESISKSRQVVFVLTPGLLERKWTAFEIEQAKYEKIHKHLQVTVINLGVDAEDIPVAFTSIWHDVCLIEWFGYHDECQSQWEKLKMRLVLNR